MKNENRMTLRNYYWRTVHFIRNLFIPSIIWWRLQRFYQWIFWGFTDYQLMDLDYELCKWFLPRLERYMKHFGKDQIPGQIYNEETVGRSAVLLFTEDETEKQNDKMLQKWIDIQETIHYYVKARAKGDKQDYDEDPKYKLGQEYLGKYLECFWF